MYIRFSLSVYMRVFILLCVSNDVYMMCVCVCMYIRIRRSGSFRYGVATISRLLKIIGLFCRISSLLYGSFAYDTVDLAGMGWLRSVGSIKL